MDRRCCEHFLGWANIAVENWRLKIAIVYATKKPRVNDGVAFRAVLETEIERFRLFLRC